MKQRRRADRAIDCAHPVAPPSSDHDLPSKPECVGGKLVVLNSMPPRWSCVCPKGATRRQTGKNAYVCTGFPGGSQSDPTKDCLKKGWKWTRKGCVEPNGRCPKGLHWQAAQVHQAAAAELPKGLRRQAAKLHETDA